jgi:hypothetical protein
MVYKFSNAILPSPITLSTPVIIVDLGQLITTFFYLKKAVNEWLELKLLLYKLLSLTKRGKWYKRNIY